MRATTWPLPDLVDAAVADVRPVGRALLHQAQRAGGARALLERQVRAERDDVLVRAAERRCRKPSGSNSGCGVLPEARGQRGARGLGGAGAVGVAAHAVDRDHERRVLADGDGDAVLVVLAVADEAEVRGFDLQRPFPAPAARRGCYSVRGVL